MQKIFLYSFLLVLGLFGSQLVPLFSGDAYPFFETFIKLVTMVCLSYIMIHVGYEFQLDKKNIKKYGWDYFVAATAAGFPWIFCALYYVYVLPADQPPEDLWKNALLSARFSAPTSAGVLFSMLAAAGLGATWVFKKARILAIFDDLDTVLFMIPLKIMFTGFHWESAVTVFFIFLWLWLAWKYLHKLNIPHSWPWVLFFSLVITFTSESIYLFTKNSKFISTPVHIEVLLPAFVLGCMTFKPFDASHHVQPFGLGLETSFEKRVSDLVSAVFMLFVGLSMPPIINFNNFFNTNITASLSNEILQLPNSNDVNWPIVFMHVFFVAIISNLGKMFPAFCYKKEASFRERLALAVSLFPRGEVGAGVLVVSVSLGIKGTMILVSMLALSLNLILTGVFIGIVKLLIEGQEKPATKRLRS